VGIIEVALLGAVIGGLVGAALHFLRQRRTANQEIKRNGGA
jgi:hypothetical protein